MGLFVVLNLNAQNMITEKGYYYSPNGFVCYEGDIYTADMKNDPATSIRVMNVPVLSTKNFASPEPRLPGLNNTASEVQPDSFSTPSRNVKERYSISVPKN